MLKLSAFFFLFCTLSVTVTAADVVYIPGSASTFYDESSVKRNGDFATATVSGIGEGRSTVIFDCAHPRLLMGEAGWTNISELSSKGSTEATWLRSKACWSWKHPTSWFK